MLLLDNYFFPVISIHANPHFEPSNKDTHNKAAIDINGNFAITEDDKTCTAVLNISVRPPEEGIIIPYEIEITAVGSFSIPEGLTTDQIGEKAPIFAFSILYTSAREMILTLTGRGPWAPTLLPVHTFQADHLEEDSEDVTQQSKREKKISTKRKKLK